MRIVARRLEPLRKSTTPARNNWPSWFRSVFSAAKSDAPTLALALTSTPATEPSECSKTTSTSKPVAVRKN